MPMNFPDYESIQHAARVHGFRLPQENEREEDFRQALADHVEAIDLIESMEIRTKHGWDQMTPAEEQEILIRTIRRNRA
jgi:hypothetical protein